MEETELEQGTEGQETEGQEVEGQENENASAFSQQELQKPYHLDPRFQEILKQRDEAIKEKQELEEKLAEFETLKQDFYGEEEPSDTEQLKSRITDLETQLYQQQMEQQFRDLLPQFPTLSQTDVDRDFIKALMLAHPEMSMEEAMRTLHSHRENRDKKTIENYLASKKASRGISSVGGNVLSLPTIKTKSPETLEEAREVAKKILSEVI